MAWPLFKLQYLFAIGAYTEDVTKEGKQLREMRISVHFYVTGTLLFS